MAKKTAKKATKPAASKGAKATIASKKKSVQSKVASPVKAKKTVASAKKASPKKELSSKKADAKKNGKNVKPIVAKKAEKTSKPVKPAAKAGKDKAKTAAKSTVTAKPVKAAPKPAPKPVKKTASPKVEKPAPAVEKVAPKAKAPVKKEKITAPAETPAPVEKKMTQAQLKAIAKKEREYKNSPEFKATLPVRKRHTEEVFEVYKPKKDVRTSKHIKFELEYFFNASNRLLYEFFSTASGLQDWFADDVRINSDGTLSFYWEGTEQRAKLLFKRDGVVARYKWIEEPSDTYFEFRIEIDDLTGDVAMIITDFAEDQQSVENAKMLWDSQVNALKHAIGAY